MDLNDKYLHSNVTSTIIKAYYNVYNKLGYGFLEKVYERALIIELKKFGLICEKQKAIKVFYDTDCVGEYYADIIVNDCVIIELKAAECLLEEHEAQLINYLRATKIEVGLLLNFGKEAEFKRKAFNNEFKNHKPLEKIRFYHEDHDNLRSIKPIKMRKSILIALLLTTSITFAQTKSVLIMNATAHIGNDSVIQNSIIGLKAGKIVLVADAKTANFDKTAYDEVIDATGKHVYPGIIAPNSTLGLTEIESVRATNDFRETGTTLPNVRSLIAYNTDSKIIPTVRSNGILLAQITPRGGLVSGTSSVVVLDGWNWEDAAYKTDDGIHINWPTIQSRKFLDEDNLFAGPFEKNKDYIKQTEILKKLFADAKAYNELPVKEEANLRFEAMKGLFYGTQTLFIHSNTVKEMVEAINFVILNKISKVAIVGGKESWMITDLLKQNNISLVIARVHDLPTYPEDDIDLPYKLPYILQKAGILFCLNNEGDMEAMGARNLPFLAGTAAAYGLTKEQALKSITLNTAKILGIDKTVGSIEMGKDATIFISTGDALDMMSNNVERAFVKGNNIDLNNDQKMLYEKYKTKYGIK